MSWLAAVTGLYPNAYYVARREYVMRVRSRTFAVLTAVLAVLGIGLTLLPLGIRVIGGDKPVKLAVYSTAADLAPPASALAASLNAAAGVSGTGGTSTGGATGAASGPRYTVEEVSDPAPSRDLVRRDKLDGLLTIRRLADGDLTFDLFSKDAPDSQRLAFIRNAATQLAISDRLGRAGIAAQDRGAIFAPTTFSTTPADPVAARRGQDQFVPSYVLSTVFVILMFMAIQVYGNWVAASVAEEKSSRVMELLISAATPRQLLLGKVLGTGAAGLTQYAAILAAALVGYIAQGGLAQRLLGDQAADLLPGITPGVLIGLGIFFVAGFTLYAILYAAAGSMVSRQEDIQQVAGPLTFVGLAAYLLSYVAISSIDAPWVSVLSFVPFVSPFFFPARMLLSEVAPWEYMASLAFLLLGIIGALWVAARIYAAGVLLYGQRPTFRTLLNVTFGRARG